MDSVAKVTFSGSKTVSEKNLPEIHLLPCKINYTGPAKVKAYFQRESVGENGEEQSTFRGRYLNGSMMHLPDGYKMFVTKQRTTNGTRQVFDEEGSVDSFMLWEYDRIPSEKNPIPRALNFLKIAADLAADD